MVGHRDDVGGPCVSTDMSIGMSIDMSIDMPGPQEMGVGFMSIDTRRTSGPVADVQGMDRGCMSVGT